MAKLNNLNQLIYRKIYVSCTGSGRPIQGGLLTVGDVAFYDQVLTLSATLGAISERHCGDTGIDIDYEQLFD